MFNFTPSKFKAANKKKSRTANMKCTTALQKVMPLRLLSRTLFTCHMILYHQHILIYLGKKEASQYEDTSHTTLSCQILRIIRKTRKNENIIEQAKLIFESTQKF